MANPNVNLDLFRDDYEMAMQLLTDIRDGKNNIDLPYKQDDPNTPEDEAYNGVAWKSNPQRTNFF